MVTERPMSEYEAALFSAVLAIGRAAIRMGANETVLLAEIKEAEHAQRLDGRQNGAALLKYLAKDLCEPPNFFVPGNLPPQTQ
jgi:hypothetical protein